MKKVLLTSAITAIAAIGFTSAAAIAAPTGNGTTFISPTGFGGDPSLQDVINSQFSGFTSDVVGDQSGIGAWTGVDAISSAFKVSYAFDGLIGDFGIYDLTDVNNTQSLLSSSTGDIASFLFSADGSLFVNASDTGTDFSGAGFGFYYDVDGAGSSPTYYTENDKNPGGNGHAVSYIVPDGTAALIGGVFPVTATGDNDWLLAFDVNNFSTFGTSRWDMNDAVFFIEDLAPVPEPTTMLLFGAGLAGLAGVSRRRKK